MATVGVDEKTLKAAVGGSRDKGTCIELYTQFSVYNADESVRKTADVVGGVVASARTPVSAAFVRANEEGYEVAILTVH